MKYIFRKKLVYEDYKKGNLPIMPNGWEIPIDGKEAKHVAENDFRVYDDSGESYLVDKDWCEEVDV